MRTPFLAVAAATILLSLPALATTTGNTTAATFSGNDVNLLGSAAMQGAALQLTGSGSNQAGAAWLTSALSTSQSFSASFGFSLANYGSGTMADGLAFVLQSKGTNVVGAPGGNIGYFELAGVGSVVQSWDNNTAGLNISGSPYDTKKAPTALGSAQLVTGHQTVSYDAFSHTLSMTGSLVVDGSVFQVSDSVAIDLYAKFGSTMYAGFTGGTGGAVADQRITSFSVAAVPEPETYALLIAGLGLLGVVARRREHGQATA